MLTSHTQTPEVSQSSVSTDLLQTLQVITKLRVDVVREDLVVLAVDDVLLSVKEPGGDLVLRGVLDDGDNTLEFFGGDFTSAVFLSVCASKEKKKKIFQRDIPLGQINIGLLADQVAVSATDTLDLGQGVHDLLLAIDLYLPVSLCPVPPRRPCLV